MGDLADGDAARPGDGLLAGGGCAGVAPAGGGGGVLRRTAAVCGAGGPHRGHQAVFPGRYGGGTGRCGHRAGGTPPPARQCGLRTGDIITHIDGRQVDTIEEVQSLLQAAGGETMAIQLTRGGRMVETETAAVQCMNDGSYRLGAWIRDSMAGIGTITYYDPDSGKFAALGHGINDIDTKLLMPLESGAIMGARVSDVQTGQKGTPGELHGTFDLEQDLGTLYANTDCGVFGVTSGAKRMFCRRGGAGGRKERGQGGCGHHPVQRGGGFGGGV